MNRIEFALGALCLCSAAAAQDASEWRMDYDEDGRGFGIIAPNGKEIRHEWSLDEAGRLEEVQARYDSETQTTWTFDAKGRRESMVDSAGKTVYGYDAFDRLVLVRRSDRPVVELAWDREDRLAEIRVGQKWYQRFRYSLLGDLKSIETPHGTISYHIDASGRVAERVLPNGAKSVWHLDPEGRIEQLRHWDGDGKELAAFDYTYRPDGLVGEIREAIAADGVVTSALAYDTLGRLRSRTQSDGEKREYRFDVAGNLVERSSSTGLQMRSQFDGLGRILSHGGVEARDDEAGNLASRMGASGRLNLAYDARSVLREVRCGTQVVRYVHDGDGMLLEREVDKRKTIYVANPLSADWEPLWAQDPDGKERFFVWSGGQLVAVLNNDTYFLEDMFGYGRLFINRFGDLIGRIDFDDYGRPESLGTYRDFVPGVRGRLIDARTGLYTGSSVAFDPRVNRPLQSDPVQTSLLHHLSRPELSVTDRTLSLPDVKPAHEMLTEHVTSWAISTVTSPDFLRGLPGVESNKKLMKAIGIYDDARQLSPFGPAKKISAVFKNAETVHHSPYEHQAWRDYWMSVAKLGSFFSKPLGVITAGFENVKGAIEMMERPARARAMQNRAINSLGMRWDVMPRHLDSLHEVIWDDFGTFSARGEGFEAHAVWKKYTRDLPLWTARAGYRYKNRFLADGSLASGTGTVKRLRWEAGGAVRDVKITRTREHVRRNGQAIHDAVEAYNRTGDPNAYHRALKKGYDVPRRRDEPPPLVIPSGGGGGGDDGGGGGGGGGGGWSGGGGTTGGWDPGGATGVWKSSGTTGSWGDGGGRFPKATDRGGISLAGVGKALSGLGPLAGVAVEPDTQRLLLLAADGRRISLPPIRISDLVAIFRAVYLQGESPSVTIEPYPQNPKGEFMFVKNDVASNQTFPGWVLFQADRIMKAYSLGKDNVTREPVQTSIPNYRSVLQGLAASKGPVDPNLWNRFEIVPDRVVRTSEKDVQLTLLSVGLKVETDMRRLAGARLVKATGRTVPPHAASFAQWFTDNLSALAKEARVPAPEGFEDRGEYIHVFAELRRVALLAAIAEALRDQGVPMPVWMRTYEVPVCSYALDTPSLTVSETNDQSIYSIFGGVRLTPPPEKLKRPPARGMERQLAALAGEMEAVPDATVVDMSGMAGVHTAVALPGTGGADFGACRMEASDLSVPLGPGVNLELNRRYNSFCNPRGSLGVCWTMNLPRIAQRRRPKRAELDGVDGNQWLSVIDLYDPLGTVNAIFDGHRTVPGFRGPLMVTRQPSEYLGLAQTRRKDVGFETTVAYLRDGSEWHFDSRGNSVATVKGDFVRINRRDREGRITTIEGWVGGVQLGRITLEYDEANRVVAARDSGGASVSYHYDSKGHLVSALTADGLVRYEYRGDLLSSVSHGQQPAVAFRYDEHGRIIGQRNGGGPWVTTTYRRDDGNTFVERKIGEDQVLDVVAIEDAGRSRWRADSNGSLHLWEVGEDGQVRETLSFADGSEAYWELSADGRVQRCRPRSGAPYEAVSDAEGRLLAVKDEAGSAMELEWGSAEQLKRITAGSLSLEPSYTAAGKVATMRITDGEDGDQPMVVELDSAGRPSRVRTDNSPPLELSYAPDSGELARLSAGDQWAEARRDEQGRIRAWDTSWGRGTDWEYDAQGRPRVQAVRWKDATWKVDYDGNEVSAIDTFEGGRLEMQYKEYEGGRVLQAMKLPDGTTAVATHDEQGRLTRYSTDPRSETQLERDSAGRITSVRRSPLAPNSPLRAIRETTRDRTPAKEEIPNAW